jgi:hypothetical protein
MKFTTIDKKNFLISVFFLFFSIYYSLGTHFDEVAVGSLINETIQGGKTAFLNCKINLLQDKTVRVR